MLTLLNYYLCVCSNLMCLKRNLWSWIKKTMGSKQPYYEVLNLYFCVYYNFYFLADVHHIIFYIRWKYPYSLVSMYVDMYGRSCFVFVCFSFLLLRLILRRIKLYLRLVSLVSFYFILLTFIRVNYLCIFGILGAK